MIAEDNRRSHGEWSDTPFIELTIRIGLLGLLCYWTLTIVHPLLAVLIWGVVLAVALYPAFDWLASILGGRRKLAALIITTICILIVIGPVAWALVSSMEGVQMFSRSIETGELTFPQPSLVIKKLPLIGDRLYDLWELTATNFRAGLAQLAPQLKPIGRSLLGAAGSATAGIVTFLASVVIAGFMFDPAPSLIAGVKALSHRIIGGRGDDFVALASVTIRNVSRGVIGIAILQAGLAGAGMATAHIPAASFITLMALILGIVQVGPAIVLIPVIIWSWLVLDTIFAVIFTAYMIPVCLVDNILRPVVMGRGLITPMPVVFAGLIGGVLAHGMIGVFIGPVVLAVAWALVVAWIAGDDPRSIPTSK